MTAKETGTEFDSTSRETSDMFWVAFEWRTSDEFTVRVTDTTANQTRQYVSEFVMFPEGGFRDTEAFATCL